MSSTEQKKAIDISNLVLNAAIAIALGVFGFYGSKAYTKIEETHDMAIRDNVRMDAIHDHQVEQDAQIKEQDGKLYRLLTQKQ